MLDGSMIPRSVRRVFDERLEPRAEAESQTAVLEVRERRHVVRLVNIVLTDAIKRARHLALLPFVSE